MGASSSVLSLSSLSAVEIGEMVAGLGVAYLPYKDSIVENGISGEIIASASSDSELMEMLTDLGITNNLHKRVINTQLQKFKQMAEGISPQQLTTQSPPPSDTTATEIPTSAKSARESVPMADAVSSSPRVIMSKLFMLQGIKVDPSDLDSSFQLLESVIGKGHGDGVNSYDCFINYRVATEADVAEKLYYYLRSNGIHAFLDRKCLKNGQNWKDGFLTGKSGQ